MFTAALGAYIVYGGRYSAATAGFSLDMAGRYHYRNTKETAWCVDQWVSVACFCGGFGPSIYLKQMVRLPCIFFPFPLIDEGYQAIGMSSCTFWHVFSDSGSLERIQQYLEIEQEPEASNAGVPPAYWPASGNLVVENLTARYSSVSIFVIYCWRINRISELPL